MANKKQEKWVLICQPTLPLLSVTWQSDQIWTSGKQKNMLQLLGQTICQTFL